MKYALPAKKAEKNIAIGAENSLRHEFVIEKWINNRIAAKKNGIEKILYFISISFGAFIMGLTLIRALPQPCYGKARYEAENEHCYERQKLRSKYNPKGMMCFWLVQSARVRGERRP